MPRTLVALGDLPRFKDVPFNQSEYIGYDKLVVREFDTNNLYKARKG